MGKYATYRKRGGGGSSVTALGPPPAPNLEDADGALIVTPNTTEWPGGQFTLYYSLAGIDPWLFTDNSEAEPIHNWGEISAFESGFYRATETGNGVDFLGESAPSPNFQVEN